MRLILTLLVLIFVSAFVNAEHCKQLCADKKTCCSSPLNNEYHLKSIECNSDKKTSCGYDCLKMDNLFATSDHFGCGSIITICDVGSKYSDVDIVKASGSGSGSSGTSGSSGSSGKSVVSSLMSSSMYASATADVGLSVSSITGEVSSDMSSIMGSMSSGDGGDDDVDDDDGASLKRKGKKVYKGGNGGAFTIYGKCIKVTTIDSNKSSSSPLITSKPTIGVSKQVCLDLFGSESCDEKSTLIVVQSTLNDGFANEGTFPVTHEDYFNIIRHGAILRDQCQLKGKCQFTNNRV